MSKNIDNDEENQLLLRKIMNLIPKDEQAELIQKVDNLTTKNVIPNHLSKSKKIKIKNEKYGVSNENFSLNPENMITSIESFEDSNNPSKDNNNLIQQKESSKNESEHITLFEETEEEKENTFSLESKNKKEKQQKNSQFCGNKRKMADELIKKEEDEVEKETNPNIKIQNESTLDYNKNNNSLFIEAPIDKEEKPRRIIPEKEQLKNLIKREGFTKIFNYLTIIPLDRTNPIEREIDDIITSLGLLRTSLIIFQIKFEDTNSNLNINSNTYNTRINNSINNIVNINEDNKTNNSNSISPIINKNKNKTQIINPKKNDEDIQIVIDGVEEEKSSNENQKSNISSFQINKTQNLNNTVSKNVSPTKSKSVKKDINKSKEDLELGVHLQKDKNGKIYKYTKHHYRANRGNDIYVYYCADTRCKTKGCYFVKSMKFECIKKHELPYHDHCYVKNKDRFDKYRPIIDEFEKRECHEAQIFKKSNGSQLVKWYD